MSDAYAEKLAEEAGIVREFAKGVQPLISYMSFVHEVIDHPIGWRPIAIVASDIHLGSKLCPFGYIPSNYLSEPVMYLIRQLHLLCSRLRRIDNNCSLLLPGDIFDSNKVHWVYLRQWSEIFSSLADEPNICFIGGNHDSDPSLPGNHVFDALSEVVPSRYRNAAFVPLYIDDHSSRSVFVTSWYYASKYDISLLDHTPIILLHHGSFREFFHGSSGNASIFQSYPSWKDHWESLDKGVRNRIRLVICGDYHWPKLYRITSDNDLEWCPDADGPQCDMSKYPILSHQTKYVLIPGNFQFCRPGDYWESVVRIIWSHNTYPVWYVHTVSLVPAYWHVISDYDAHWDWQEYFHKKIPDDISSMLRDYSTYLDYSYIDVSRSYIQVIHPKMTESLADFLGENLSPSSGWQRWRYITHRGSQDITCYILAYYSADLSDKETIDFSSRYLYSPTNSYDLVSLLQEYIRSHYGSSQDYLLVSDLLQYVLRGGKVQTWISQKYSHQVLDYLAKK